MSTDFFDPPKRYGIHIDGNGKFNMDNYEALNKLIYDVAKASGMNIINVSTNHVFNNTPNDGYSVLALITTSHISIHTWPAYNYFMFDLVSCKPFDQNAILRVLAEYISMGDVAIEHTGWDRMKNDDKRIN